MGAMSFILMYSVSCSGISARTALARASGEACSRNMWKIRVVVMVVLGGGREIERGGVW